MVLARNDNYSTAVSTNSYGFYSISIPKGQYIVECNFLGYEKQVFDVNLSKNIDISAFLKMNIQELKIVMVTNTDNLDLTKNNPLKNNLLSSFDLSKKPLLGGDNDVIKSLQSIAGTNLYGEGSVIFNVRGGDKGQNAIFIDEAPIYNPSHLLGFFSSVAPDAINSIGIYKNAFPVQYTGRLSSLISIHTKNGNMNNWGFSGNISPLLSTLTLDGPLRKEKSSVLFSVRKSHINYLFKKSVPKLALDFYDVHFKYNFKFDRENRFYIAFYNGYDNIQFQNSALRWKNSTFTLRWNHLFSDKIFSNTTIYASSYKYFLNYSLSDNIYWISAIKNLSVKNDITYYKSDKSTFLFGFESSFRNFNPGNLNYGEYFLYIVQAGSVFDNSIYLGQEYRPTQNLMIKYGLRWLNWKNLGPTTVYSYDENYNLTDTNYVKFNFFNKYNRIEHSESVIWSINKKISLLVSYNHNVQFLHYLSNSISPFTTLDVWMPSNNNLKPQSVNQFVVGLYSKLTEYEFSVEFYFKKSNQQLDFSNQPNTFLNPLIESELRFGTITSYGSEFSFKKSKGDFKFVINYTYSRAIRYTENINFNNPYPAVWDKPHNLYCDFSYSFSDRTSIYATFVYFSGNRFSSPTGYYYFQNITIPIYEQKNNDKLPDYHRLDFAFKWRLNKKNENKFTHFLTFSIYNFYAHKNIIAVNFNKIETNDGTIVVPANFVAEHEILPTSLSLLGFVPSVSYQFNFR